jgi:predicted DNA-binding transcriptional regulator AlpA
MNVDVEWGCGMDELRLLSYRDVRRVTSLSESTIRRLVKAGAFPVPKALPGTQGRVAFASSEVAAWVRRAAFGASDLSVDSAPR